MNIENLKKLKCPFCNILLNHESFNNYDAFYCDNENCRYWKISKFQIEINSKFIIDRVFIIFEINDKWYQFYKSIEFRQDNKIYLSQLIEDKEHIDLFDIEDNSEIDLKNICVVAKNFIEKYLKLQSFG